MQTMTARMHTKILNTKPPVKQSMTRLRAILDLILFGIILTSSGLFLLPKP